MGNNWTEEQKQVICHSEGDLLVAAAAGSGKTAVLVERIVTMLQDKEHPIDIDRMLVVTFTRAAAAEMRERIGNRIAELLNENPENEQLQRQQLLLHHAQITTIDSFCMQVVREFFHTINIDPGFRIGDEAEMKLLQSDVLKEVLEENYAAAEENFLRFVECYAPGKTDTVLEEYVMKLFQFSESYVWPEKWLEEQAASFEYEGEEAFAKSPLLKEIMQETTRRTKAALEDIRRAEELVLDCALEGYRDAVQADKKFLENLAERKNYVTYSECVRTYKFGQIGRCKKDVDPEAREQAKAFRDRCKDTINELIKQYYFQDFHTMYEDMCACAQHMQELIRLTGAFRKKYSEAKQDKNILDFSDLGHYALRILLTEQEDGYVPSEAAGILRGRFDRIMIDEYQDSNQIQETLLRTVSRLHEVSADCPKGRPNIFMVGDVKQSIYRFRQACPELFMDKYDAYGQGDPAYEKIVLKKNFRSRPTVLDAVNSVFEWCMHREFGGIEYDTDAALHAGLPYVGEDGVQSPYDPELVLVYHEEESEEESVEKVVAEAHACAERIRRLTDEENGLPVTVSGETRRARFGDIAILLRSAKGWADTFVNVLRDQGIPATASISGGFFEAGEVVTVLNYLRVLDNPKQDIPLAQVLLSPVGGFSNNELAKMKCGIGKLYDSMNAYLQRTGAEDNGEDNGLVQKAERFMEGYRYFRQRMKYLPVSDLIQEIYQKTGLYAVMSALPAGEQRAANLEYLLRHAQKYETTSYHGLFQFVRYVEKLKDNEVDFGEASTVDAGNAVKIMTIHKSKGLEFPIVLLPGCGKAFNQTDANTRVVLHAEYGLGPECVDSEKRTRVTSLKKQYIRQMLRQETVAEELRMLYVAMTRAKEKLILLGSVGELEKFLASCMEGGDRIDYRRLAAANSYLDFMKGIVLRSFAERAADSLQADNPVSLPVAATGQSVVWHFVPTKAGAISTEETVKLLETEARREAFRTLMECSKEQAKTSLYEELQACISFCYPYEAATVSPLKTSVSELKRRMLLTEEEQEAERPAWVKKTGGKIPEKQAAGISGAERGSLYHKLLELLPFEEVRTAQSLQQFTEGLIHSRRMTREEADCIEAEKLLAFLKSELAERIRDAAVKGQLKREQPFVLGIEAKGSGGDYELIQGIIDLYFEEEDGIVLLDYKTDRIENASELVERYRIQLEYYAQAIRRITKKTVKEIYIYSLYLSQTIRVE